MNDLERRLSPGFILLLAVGFGLLSGFAEAITKSIIQANHPTRIYFHWVVFGRFWLLSLAQCTLFCLTGLPFALLAWWKPKWVPVQLVIALFVSLLFLNLRFVAYKVHEYAWLLLCIGLGVQVSYLICKRLTSLRKVLRVAVSGLLVVTFSLAIGMHGWRIWQEHRAVASLPATGPHPPNVLLIVMDTVGAKHLTLHDYFRPTSPHLERLAREGVYFANAISTSSWTLPSHASMFTGRNAQELSVNWERALDNTYPTLAEVLQEHGYETAGFVANLLYLTPETEINRGFIHYEHRPISVGQIIMGSWLPDYVVSKIRRKTGHHSGLNRIDADYVSQNFLGWLSHRDERHPFFAFLNYFDAHTPYTPPVPFDTKFADRGIRVSQPSDAGSPDELEVQLGAHDGAIAYLDSRINLLLEELRQRKLLENTLVLITSDHGEEFGEHGFYGHANSLYRQELHVPLLMLFPSRIPAGKRIDEPVSLRDISATVMDLLSLGKDHPFPGNSLSRCWQGPSLTDLTSPLLSEVRKGINTPVSLPVSQGDMQSVVTEQWHYIQNGDGSEELYDFGKDIEEVYNLAESESSQSILQEHRALLPQREESISLSLQR